MNYTKGKWEVVANLDGSKTIIRTRSGFVAVTKVTRAIRECEANAERIVKAVNCHDDLYEALKAIINSETITHRATFNNALEALARAEGKDENV